MTLPVPSWWSASPTTLQQACRTEGHCAAPLPSRWTPSEEPWRQGLGEGRQGTLPSGKPVCVPARGLTSFRVKASSLPDLLQYLPMAVPSHPTHSFSLLTATPPSSPFITWDDGTLSLLLCLTFTITNDQTTSEFQSQYNVSGSSNPEDHPLPAVRNRIGPQIITSHQSF